MNTAMVTQENTAAAEEMSAGADSALSHLTTVSRLSGEAAESAGQVSSATTGLAETTLTVAESARELVETARRLTEVVAKFQV
ncbi:MAG TPA: hypothetical protein VGK74_04600 [Symbiobacteriaceae bacterium]|jgi:methyl-accepting chemotaxis protein